MLLELLSSGTAEPWSRRSRDTTFCKSLHEAETVSDHAGATIQLQAAGVTRVTSTASKAELMVSCVLDLLGLTAPRRVG